MKLSTKILITVAAALAWSALANAQGTPYQIHPVAQAGTILRVCGFPATGNPCSNVSAIFSDAGLSLPVPNPIVMGSGSIIFFVASGSYTVQLSGATNDSYIFTVSSAGGGGNCTVVGGAGVIQASNGTGGCEATSITDNGTVTFGAETVNMAVALDLIVPSGAGFIPPDTGGIGFNTTAHTFTGTRGGLGGSGIVFANFLNGFSFTNGDCIEYGTNIGNGTLIDSGAPCPSGIPSYPVTVSGTVNSGGIPCFTSTVQESSSATLPASDILVGGGAGVCPTASALQVVANTIQNSVNTTGVVYQGGTDASALGNLGPATVRGANQTGAGGVASAGGAAIIQGGSNAGTNAASQAGSVEVAAGISTAGGLQGLLFLSDAFVKGGGTSTQWNLQCIVGTTAMTVNDCAATPANIQGVALIVNANTVQVHTLGSETPVNASAAVTVGDTVCAGATAGKVTDSGGTGQCATGITVGNVLAVSGTYILPISGTVTLSTTLPLIQIQRTQSTAAAVTFANLPGGTNTTSAFVLGTGSSFTDSIAGAASTSAMTFTGLPFAGTGTTSFPLLYFNGGTAPTTWTTFGTYLGFNTASGFFGNVIDVHQNGSASTFALNGGGFVTSAGVIQANQGFANTALQHIFVSGTAPTIASGFGTTPSIPNNNGTAAFTVNVGTGGAASSGVITMPAAAVGWACHVTPNGAPQAAAVTYSAPTSTTSITLTNYTATTGVALAWTASTVLQVLCDAY
jgi:hypothetical protein